MPWKSGALIALMKSAAVSKVAGRSSCGSASSTRQGSKAIAVAVGSTSSRSAEPGTTFCPIAAAVMEIERVRLSGELFALRAGVGRDVLILDLGRKKGTVPPGAERKVVVPVAKGRLIVTLMANGGRDEAVEPGLWACEAFVFAQSSSMNLLARTTGSKMASRKARSFVMR